MTDDVMDNSNGVSYVADSYWALGQDGGRYNQSIISPTNTSIPDSVTTALYYMSDHLPVVMEIALDYTAAVDENLDEKLLRYDFKNRRFHLDQSLIGRTMVIYDLSGKVMWDKKIESITLDHLLPKGTFVVSVVSETAVIQKKIIVHD